MRNVSRDKNKIKHIRFLKVVLFVFVIVGPIQARLFAEPLSLGAIWYPPFYVIELDGDEITNISGINIEIISKVLDRLGETYTIEMFPAKRLYANLASGRTQVFYGLTIPESVVPSSAVLHSRNKISKLFLRAYSFGDTPVIADRYDLRNQKVIVFRGHGYGGFIDFVKDPDNNITVFSADTQLNAFKMLKKRRAKYLIAPELPAMHVVKSLPDDYLPNLKWSPRLAHADGHFIISRKTPNSEELRDRMDETYLDLLKEGAFKGLIVE